jgi:hypothetical protein
VEEDADVTSLSRTVRSYIVPDVDTLPLSLIYYKSEVTQNSKTLEKNSFVLYFLGVFFFT